MAITSYSLHGKTTQKFGVIAHWCHWCHRSCQVNTSYVKEIREDAVMRGHHLSHPITVFKHTSTSTAITLV